MLDFPPTRPVMLDPPSQLQLTLSLRWAETSDLPWLRMLYRHTRAAELAAVPWHESAKHAFLDSQFALQHHHYVTHFASGDFLIVQHASEPIGRLYLHQADEELHVVDISLLSTWQGRGIGSALLAQLQTLATERSLRAICLSVDRRNDAARALYERMGFHIVSSQETHHYMRWPTKLVS